MVDQQSSDVDFPECAELLPAWFSERMMSDVWSFGLLMITGDIIAISSINNITKDASGNLWLDANFLLDSPLSMEDINGHKLLIAPTSRTTISINSSHVVAAFELADT